MQNNCPQCGAPAEEFDPELTMYTCPFCSHAYEVKHPRREQLLREKRDREREAERAREKDQRDRDKQQREKDRKSSERAGAIIPILVVGSVLGLAGGITYYEEYVKPGHWDGHSSFTCSKGTFTFTEVQATSDLNAKGNCQVTLVRPVFESTVKASEHAIVTVEGGRIHDSSNAIEASGFAKVTLNGTTIDGRVSSKGSAVVESKNATINGKTTSDGPANLVGFPAVSTTATATPRAPVPAPPVTTSRKNEPGSKACAGITTCYKTHTGQIQGHLVVNIDAQGNTGAATYTGNATPDQKKCLIDLAKTKSFVGVDPLPGAGQLICDYAGTVTPGTQMMQQSGSFVPANK